MDWNLACTEMTPKDIYLSVLREVGLIVAKIWAKTYVVLNRLSNLVSEPVTQNSFIRDRLYWSAGINLVYFYSLAKGTACQRASVMCKFHWNLSDLLNSTIFYFNLHQICDKISKQYIDDPHKYMYPIYCSQRLNWKMLINYTIQNYFTIVTNGFRYGWKTHGPYTKSQNKKQNHHSQHNFTFILYLILLKIFFLLRVRIIKTLKT